MLHEKVGKQGTRNRGRYQVAQSLIEQTLLICNYHFLKLQLHDAIYRLRFYSDSLIHILSLSNSHNVASLQKNRGDKSHRVIVALVCGLNSDEFIV